MSVSEDFDLTRLNELDYSSSRTEQNEAGRDDLLHGRVAARKFALDRRVTTGSAMRLGDIVRGSRRTPIDTRFIRIVGKRTRSLRRGGTGRAASFSFSYF